MYQFLINTPNFEDSWIAKAIEKLDDIWIDWIKWAGFHKYDGPIWYHLLPYVVFFSLSVLLLKNFRKKDQMENKILFTDKDLENLEKQREKMMLGPNRNQI